VRELNIQTPEVFEPLLEPKRLKGARGGRGSGKSWFFADSILEAMVLNPELNVACMREVQKSIAKSSKKLLEDRIKFYGLGDYFEVQKTEIKSNHGDGAIIFQGLQDHTADSIKSLEGFDICWIEEAQTITEFSLDLLIPTFRKDDSEIWLSWNSRLRTDAVEKLFKNRENAIMVHANYVDNPFCPQIIIDEAEEMKEKDSDKYDHIFMGGFVNDISDRLFTYTEVHNAMSRHGDTSGSIVIGIDVARFGGDSSVNCIRQGLQVLPFQMREKLSTVETANWSAHNFNKYKADGAIIDTIGVGAGVFDNMISQGFYCVDGNFGMKADENDVYINKRAECYFRLKESLGRGLALPHDEELIEELLAISYVFTETGKIKLQSKDKIKEELGGKSPDKSDALALTFFTRMHKQHTESYDDNFTVPNIV
jgi:hypothetical protein